MSDYIYKTPEGFNDVLFNECMNKVEIENRVRSVFRTYGFYEVDTPTLEYYDLFSGKIDTLPQERMFKLFDLKGRILVLRPDITVPIMRMTATKLGNMNYPIRLSYFGNVFRNDLKNLINCEYRQAGIEILGSDSIAADAEIISVTIKSLLQAGIDDFSIDIGQVKLFKALTAEISDSSLMEEIRLAVANKDKYSIEKLLEGTGLDEQKKKCILRLPWMFGSVETLRENVNYFEGLEQIEALNELMKLIEILKDWGYEKYISIDLGMVQSLNYYSGIIFRGYASECGFSICWGGRYDYLGQNFNKTIHASGCAIGINRVLEVLERKGRLNKVNATDYLITTWNGILKDEAYKLCEVLRDKGYVVENNLLFDESKTMEYCKNRGIRKIIKVLDNEVVEVIDLNNGDEKKFSINCLLGQVM